MRRSWNGGFSGIGSGSIGRGLSAGIAAIVSAASSSLISMPSSRFFSMIFCCFFTSNLRIFSCFFHFSSLRSSRRIDSTSIRLSVRSRWRAPLAASGSSAPASPTAPDLASSASRTSASRAAPDDASRP